MKYRDFVKRLAAHSVREYPARGKGSERLLIRETEPGSRKGPQYTIKCHGEGRDVATGTMHAALRRLGIDPKDLRDDAQRARSGSEPPPRSGES